MAETFTDEVLGKSLRNTVNVQRFGEGTRRKVMRLLNDTQDEVLREIYTLDPSLRVPTAWKRERLVKLNQSVNSILDKQYGKIKNVAANDLTNLAESAMVGEAKMLNNLLGAELFDVTLTEAGLRNIVNNTLIDGQVIGDWWNTNKDNFSKRFQRQMADATKAIQIGMVKGEAVGELVRRVRGTATVPGILDVSKREATALVRTSTMQVANEARMDMYEANADLIKGYQVVATLDKRTTPICRGYDGLVWYIDKETGEMVPDGHGQRWLGSPPYHWMCRTVLLPVLLSFADLAGPKSKISQANLKKMEKKLEPRIRASMGGPTTKKTYNEWLRAQTAAVQREVLGAGRYRLWKEHGLSTTDMLHQDGRPLMLKQLRQRLGVGAEPQHVSGFRDAHDFQAVNDARIKRAIDRCYY